MTVRNPHQRTLRLTELSLLGSDPQLVAMLNVFSRLTAGQGMPDWEQLPSRRDRLREAVARLILAF